MSVDGMMMSRSSDIDRGSFGIGNIRVGLLRWIEIRSDLAVHYGYVREQAFEDGSQIVCNGSGLVWAQAKDILPFHMNQNLFGLGSSQLVCSRIDDQVY